MTVSVMMKLYRDQRDHRSESNAVVLAWTKPSKAL